MKTYKCIYCGSMFVNKEPIKRCCQSAIDNIGEEEDCIIEEIYTLHKQNDENMSKLSDLKKLLKK